MYETIKMKIKSVTPDDKFNLTGKEGHVYNDTIKPDERLLAIVGGKQLRTSLIKSITETADEIEVKTMNSVYTLEKIKEQ